MLLLSGERLVKTTQFRDPVYVGDPVNVLSIFNDFEVDEMCLLDIDGALSRTPTSVGLLNKYAQECFIPLTYGGGLRTSRQAGEVLAAGFEKVLFNTAAAEDPDEVRAAIEAFGSQAVVGGIDVRIVNGAYEVFTRSGTTPLGVDPQAWADKLVALGVGEIAVTSIDREGTRTGYDYELLQLIARTVDVPVIAHGGAGSRQDLSRAVCEAGCSAAAAGSIFVFQGSRESVLVNYPSRREIVDLLSLTDQIDALAAYHHEHGRLDSGPKVMAGFDGAGATMCRRCLFDTATPGVSFDDSGLCNYCALHDAMELQYPTGVEGTRRLTGLVEQIKNAGVGKKYDCIIGVSGGCDSSYLVHVMVEMGLRPLAVHFDNTWNSPIATANIYAVLNRLGVDLETYVADNSEYDDIYRAFMLSGTKDIDSPTDIAFMAVLYRAAEKWGIKHIIEGHSFRTEGVAPLGWIYMDGGYVKSVHERFGRVPMKTYPNMEFWTFVKWAAFSGIQRHRPLYNLDYDKEAAKVLLHERYGWQWYGGHHLDNRFTGFVHTYFFPTRWRFDFRQVELSALVRSGHLDRPTAEQLLIEPRATDRELLAMVKQRLDLTDDEFDQAMNAPYKTYLDYPSYKKRFERLRPLFWLLYKFDRVPKSFYVKFCKPVR
jgi:imidazoleglycerol phosphate synthase cyclase subunit